MARAARDASDIAGYVASNLDIVVRELAKLAIVETNLFLLGADAQRQTGNEVHEEQDDAGHDKRVREPSHTVGKLVTELDVVLVDPATGNLGKAVQTGNVIAIVAVSQNLSASPSR
jgi:hypothetical protein